MLALYNKRKTPTSATNKRKPETENFLTILISSIVYYTWKTIFVVVSINIIPFLLHNSSSVPTVCIVYQYSDFFVCIYSAIT